MKPLSELTRKLRRTLRGRGASPEDAEDLVQEAFLKFQKYERRDEVQAPEAFVVRTALNLSIDASRQRQRSRISGRPLEDYDFVDSTPGPNEVLYARQRLNRLNDGLARLSSRARSILLAQRLEGLSYAEIARRHGITVGAVEKHIARAIMFLSEWMDEW